MGDPSTDFYVTLPSSVCLDIYPNNTLSDYYIEFPAPIDLKNKKYLVGLAEVLFEGTAGKIIDGEKLTALDTNRIEDKDTHDSPYKGVSAYIYSNICEPQFVGGQKLRLLRIVPLKKSWVIFENPHYIDISSNYIPRIQVNIRDVTGRKILFDEGHLILKVHFKEIFQN